MNIFFDYVYYVLQKLYKRWDGENGVTSVIGVSMLQALIIIDTTLGIMFIFLSRDDTKSFSKGISYFGVLLFLVFCSINSKKYHNKFEMLNELWCNESKRIQFFKTSLVIIALIIPWIFLIAMGLLR